MVWIVDCPRLSAIPVFYSFARSGGTLVNQLLGVHPQCLVLSEVNPAASFKPVAEQAVDWLELASPTEANELARMPYRRQIALLRERAAQKGKTLVIRDWVTVNFLPDTAEGVEPSGRLEQNLYLEGAGLEPTPMVVTRKAAAIYKSIVTNFDQLRNLAIDAFVDAYLAYARAVAAFPHVHLESLRASPEAGVAKIIGHFQLDPAAAPAMLRDFHGFRKCTGNTTLQGRGGSAEARIVLPPEDSPAAAHPALAEADRILGYEG